MKRRDPEIALVLSRIHAMKNGIGHPHPLNVNGKKMDESAKNWLKDRLREAKEEEAKQIALKKIEAEKEREIQAAIEKVVLAAKLKREEEKRLRGYDSLAEALKDIKQETKR